MQPHVTCDLRNPKSCVLFICRKEKDGGLTWSRAHLCDYLAFLPGLLHCVFIINFSCWIFFDCGSRCDLTQTSGSAVHPQKLWMLNRGFTKDLVQPRRACCKLIHFVCWSGASQMGITLLSVRYQFQIFILPARLIWSSFAH